MPTPKPTTSSRGFTLIELLVVIAIIGILASFLLPAIMRAKTAAVKTKCLSQLAEMGKAMAIYTDRYNDSRWPSNTGGAFLEVLRTMPTPATSIISGNDQMFVCPLTDSAAAPGILDYRGPSEPVREATALNRAIASDRSVNHGNDGDVNVLFRDLHVARAAPTTPLWSQVDLETID